MHLSPSHSHTQGGFTCVRIHIGATPSRGSEVVCCILDIDLTECFLVLSLNSKLVSQPASSSPATPAKGPKERGKKLKSIAELGLSLGSSVVGVVEHKTPYYLVMSCTTLIGSMIVYGLMDTVSFYRYSQLNIP